MEIGSGLTPSFIGSAPPNNGNDRTCRVMVNRESFPQIQMLHAPASFGAQIDQGKRAEEKNEGTNERNRSLPRRGWTIAWRSKSSLTRAWNLAGASAHVVSARQSSQCTHRPVV